MTEVGIGIKGSATAMQALEYAEAHSKEKGYLSVYSHGNIKAKKGNPFEGKPPFAMDSAQFIYWCYDHAGIELAGGSEQVNVKKIRKDKRFTTIFSEGQKHLQAFDRLVAGDLLFFGSDTAHVGIYYGGGQMIAMNGSGDWDASKGIQLVDMTNGYWWEFFNGAVLRWE